MQSSLSIYAGPTARAQLLEQGVTAAQFNVMVGASGGPKWFVLYGLDRYLFGTFLQGRKIHYSRLALRLVLGGCAVSRPRIQSPQLIVSPSFTARSSIPIRLPSVK